MLTELPSCTVVPTSGTVAKTLPWEGPKAEPSFKPAAWRAAWAAATVSPLMLGTCVDGGPVDTNTGTVEPGATPVPMGGSVWSTSPAGVPVDAALDSVATSPL